MALQYHCSLYVDDDHPVFHGIFCPTRQSRKILFLFPVNLRGNHGRISVRQPVLLFLFFEIMGLTSLCDGHTGGDRGSRKGSQDHHLALAVLGGCALFRYLYDCGGDGNLSMDSLEQFREGHRGTWPLYLARSAAACRIQGETQGCIRCVWLPNAHPVAPAPASPACRAS